MKIFRIHPNELDASLCRRWREIQAGNRALASPFFSVEFTQAVAAVRNDVFVAVIEDDSGVQAFFPFQRKSSSVAGPVGGRLSDYQGMIASDRFTWDPESLLRACGLKIWDFDHLLGEQRPFQHYARAHSESHVMDLQHGLKAYVAQRKAAGTRQLAGFQRKVRKFEHELGEMRFEVYSRNRPAFARLIRWKSDQCRRTGVPDFMTWGWTTAMLERIWATDAADFSGMFSVLWYDDDILAAHFGMRSATVCHWWFPSYNQIYRSYSPGGILLLKLADAMADVGIRRIDLGKGEDAYKRAFANGAVPLMEGSVMLPSVVSTLRRTRSAARDLIRTWPLLRPARKAYGKLRSILCG